MIQEAEENADADKKARELIEARNSGESMLHSVKADLKEHGNKISDAERSNIDTAIAKLESVIDGNDTGTIQEAQKALEEVAMPLFKAKVATEQKPQDQTVVDAEVRQAA